MMRRLMIICLCMAFAGLLNAQEVRDTVVTGDDWRYEGQWPEGKGVMYSEDSGLYFGTFKEGAPEGLCLFVSLSQTEKYYGSFKDGERSGYGLLSRTGGFWYEGNFEGGYPEGTGSMYFPDMSVYTGKFHLGKPDYTAGKTYRFNNMKSYKEKLPELPEVQLTKEQKRFLAENYRKKEKDKRNFKLDESHVAPTFLGGDKGEFQQWVNSRLVYPKDAYDKGLTGTVKIEFSIIITGELADPHIWSTSGVASIDMEALRVVFMSPDWIPGTKDGKPARFTYTFPVIFQLRKPQN